MDILTSLVILIFALPHLFYAFVWRLPVQFTKIVQSYGHPVDAFSRIATLLKLVQGISIFAWLIHHPPVYQELPSLFSLTFILSCLAIFLGQILNIAIYAAIGHDGVYYGVRLGRDIPWLMVHWFSFQLFNMKIPHPQYLGSVMTLWGFVFLLYTSNTSQLLVIAAFSSLFYAVTAAIEDRPI